MRVVLIDDHPVMRLGLTVALEKTERFLICGEAGDVAGARKVIDETRPDLIVLDLSLGGRDGIEMLEELHALHPAARILVYTSFNERIYARPAIRAGAHGFLMKSADPEEVAEALLTMAEGRFVVSPSMQQEILAQSMLNHPVSATPLKELSQRELQVFRLLGSGRNSADIAAEIHLSVKTIGTYRERIKDKLNLLNGAELEAAAVQFACTGNLPTANQPSH